MALAISVRISRPPHSKQSMKALGMPILRYSDIPSLIDSLVIKKNDFLSSFIDRQSIVIIKKLKEYDIIVAIPTP